MKLSKQLRKLHQQAEDLLLKEELSMDEKLFVLENWMPGAEHDIGRSGSFFTPVDLASDFRIEAGGGKIIDLCAGIGALSFFAYHWPHYASTPDITCVEVNPRFVEVGKKILPEATWIQADVFDILDMNLGTFDKAIGNPPFGNVKTYGKTSPDYTGKEFTYHVINIASKLADDGAFIVASNAAPFRYSGAPYFDMYDNKKYDKFLDETGIMLDGGVGIDTSIFKDQWKTTNVSVEIVTYMQENLTRAAENQDFLEKDQEQYSLFLEIEKPC